MRRGTRAGVDYFNDAHPLHGVKIRVALRTRRRIFDRLMRFLAPTRDTRVLDVGTTPDLTIPYNNFFERWYPYPERLSACSTEDCSGLEARFPGLRFRRIVGDDLPFPDRHFDVAVSFAVLEHVGGEARQRHFLAECARVAERFVVYTPYRYFPVEVHTFMPFTHWLPAAWHRPLWRRIGLGFWAEEANLNLLSRRAAERIVPPFGRAGITLIRTLGWPSNIEIQWRR